MSFLGGHRRTSARGAAIESIYHRDAPFGEAERELDESCVVMETGPQSEVPESIGGLMTASGEFLIWGEGTLLEIQTEIGGVHPTPPEDIYAEIEAGAGFTDFDAGASDLPIFMETHKYQQDYGMFEGRNYRRGTYMRDPVRYYAMTGKAPRGHSIEDLQHQIDQEIEATHRMDTQLHGD